MSALNKTLLYNPRYTNNREQGVVPNRTDDNRKPNIGFYEINLRYGIGFTGAFLGYLASGDLGIATAGGLIGFASGKFVGKHFDRCVERDNAKTITDTSTSQEGRARRASFLIRYLEKINLF